MTTCQDHSVELEDVQQTGDHNPDKQQTPSPTYAPEDLGLGVIKTVRKLPQKLRYKRVSEFISIGLDRPILFLTCQASDDRIFWEGRSANNYNHYCFQNIAFIHQLKALTRWSTTDRRSSPLHVNIKASSDRNDMIKVFDTGTIGNIFNRSKRATEWTAILHS